MESPNPRSRSSNQQGCKRKTSDENEYCEKKKLKLGSCFAHTTTKFKDIHKSTFRINTAKATESLDSPSSNIPKPPIATPVTVQRIQPAETSKSSSTTGHPQTETENDILEGHIEGQMELITKHGTEIQLRDQSSEFNNDVSYELEMDRFSSEMKNLQNEIKLRDQKITELEKLRAQATKSEEATQVQFGDLQRKLSNAEKEKSEVAEDRDEKESFISVLKRQMEDLENDLKVTRETVTTLENAMETLASTRVRLEYDLSAAKVTLGQYETKMRYQESTIIGLRDDVSRQKEELAESRKTSQNEETIRRKLHNTIDELKGDVSKQKEELAESRKKLQDENLKKNDIRVLARVRPYLGMELTDSERSLLPFMKFPDIKTIELKKFNPVSPNESVASVKKGGVTGKHEFQFDRVFNPTSSQTEVFKEVSQLVQSALEGYDVCIFAYGQTGSGKTFTMEGGDEEKDRGMIQRAVEKIFSVTEDLKEKGWNFTIKFSAVEVFDNTIHDLLNSNRKSVKHELLTVGHNRIQITHLNTISLLNIDKVCRLLTVAASNQRSKGCHKVFRLEVIGSNKTSRSFGMINFVELSGSDLGGKQRRDNNLIKNMIMSVANKEKRIFPKNTMLTQIIQNSLTGNGKIVVVVNICPSSSSIKETKSSLNFGFELKCQGLLARKDDLESQLYGLAWPKRRFALKSLSRGIAEITIKFVENLDRDWNEEKKYNDSRSNWYKEASKSLNFAFCDLEFAEDVGGYRVIEINLLIVGGEDFVKAQDANMNNSDPETINVNISHKLCFLVNPGVMFSSQNSKLNSQKLKSTKVFDDNSVNLLSNFLSQFLNVVLITHGDQDSKILLSEILSLRKSVTNFRDIHFTNSDQLFRFLYPERSSYKLLDVYAKFFGRAIANQHRAESDAHALLLCCLKEKHFLPYINDFVTSLNEVIPHILRPRSRLPASVGTNH